MTLSHMHSELSGPGMWPQPEILPGNQRSQPPLARSYPAASVIYCQLDPDDRLDFSPGDEQLEWWHDFCQVRTRHCITPMQTSTFTAGARRGLPQRTCHFSDNQKPCFILDCLQS